MNKKTEKLFMKLHITMNNIRDSIRGLPTHEGEEIAEYLRSYFNSYLLIIYKDVKKFCLKNKELPKGVTAVMNALAEIAKKDGGKHE